MEQLNVEKALAGLPGREALPNMTTIQTGLWLLALLDGLVCQLETAGRNPTLHEQEYLTYVLNSVVGDSYVEVVANVEALASGSPDQGVGGNTKLLRGAYKNAYDIFVSKHQASLDDAMLLRS
jgi:hypothetical protein